MRILIKVLIALTLFTASSCVVVEPDRRGYHHEPRYYPEDFYNRPDFEHYHEH